MIRHEDIDDGPLTSKCHKVCCCHSCCLPCNLLFYPCRKAVSGSKKRYQKDGFDLDLVYISPRIIIHGFPAAGLEHIYRNPRYEIRRFMDHYHKDHYKVFNFCCEPGRGYNPEVFYGRVERYPFKDHNTPPLETMAAFANSVKQWLESDPENVVNMHCKAGKGRAGLMCCVALIRTGFVQSAKEALDLYDRERVNNNRGLTVTSQRKWVIFYEALWRQIWNVSGNIGDVPAEPLDSTKFAVPAQPCRTLSSVELLNTTKGAVRNIRVQIYKVTNFLPELLFDSQVFRPQGDDDRWNVENCICKLEGNFKIVLLQLNGAFLGYKKILELLHNTLFMDRTADNVDFALDQLDVKKKMKVKLGSETLLRLRFRAGSNPPSPVQQDSDVEPAGSIGRGGYEMVARNESVTLELVDGK